MIGRTLSHFRILAKIGEGGMGVIYRAEDTDLRRPVALKVLRPDFVGNEERRLRFLREARAAAAVTHPNIATVYEVGDSDGVVFIAMELVEGKTLRDLIGGRPMPIKDALRIATEMAEGLAEAHKAGVIHRDFKPDNVIVHSNGHPKILDFGLAKLLEERADTLDAAASKMQTISGELTREGKIFGTALYMSPEQARGKQVDARSDIFSFGTTLYEMVTGRGPFQGKTNTDILSAVIRDEPAPPSQQNAEVPPKLEDLIAKCLEKEPGERYQHTDDLSVDLRKLRRVTDSGVQTIRTPSGPMTVAPSSSWTRLVGKGTRRTVFVAAVAALLIAGGVAAWLAFYSSVGFEKGDRIIVADFENTTDERKFGTALRYALEERLTESSFVLVIGGEELKELVKKAGIEATRVDVRTADTICRHGGCDGFLVGRIERASSGYRLEMNLYRVGGRRPVITRAGVSETEDDLLITMHGIVLDIREELGEAPQSISMTTPPTTRSLDAYQAYAVAALYADFDESATLLKQALEIDPNFVWAYFRLSHVYWHLGDNEQFVRFATEAYQRSADLPDSERLEYETYYLDAMYDYDAEVDRLRAYTRRFPMDEFGFNGLGSLYLDIYADPVLAETALREAYRLNSWSGNFNMLSDSLVAQGKLDELEPLLSDYLSRGGSEKDSWNVLLRMEPEWQEKKQVIHVLRGSTDLNRLFATGTWQGMQLEAGRLKDARKTTIEIVQIIEDARFSGERRVHQSLIQEWLERRLDGKLFTQLPAFVRSAESRLNFLPKLSGFSVDAQIVEPLAGVIEMYEQALKDSNTRFVREELQFARGCLHLIRGEAERARDTLEPLARNSKHIRRHRALARTWEALGQPRKAASEYETFLEISHSRWLDFNPAVWVLDQYRLARVYERLGDTDRARHWYERFLTDWKDADPDIPELIEARKRMAALGEVEAAEAQ